MICCKIENDVVTDAIVCDDVDWANENLEGTWVEGASGIGYNYHPVAQAFSSPGHISYYVLDDETYEWVLPDSAQLIYWIIDIEDAEIVSQILREIETDEPGLFFYWEGTGPTVGIEIDLNKTMTVRNDYNALLVSDLVSQLGLPDANDFLLKIVQETGNFINVVDDLFPASWSSMFLPLP